jgi:pyruvate dehydrogenase E1 component
MSHLKTLEQRLLWLSLWMIHHANHVRPKVDGIKIGGIRRLRPRWCRS